MPFQPGVSGNPSGRSKDSLSWHQYTEKAFRILSDYELNDIKELAEDHKKLSRAMGSFDCIVLMDIYDATRDSKARARFLEHACGKQVNRIGGEIPGEGIKIQQAGVVWESIDSEDLQEFAALLRSVKQKQAAMTIEHTQHIDSAENPKTQENE